MALLKATDLEAAYAAALKATIEARERCWNAFGKWLVDFPTVDAADQTIAGDPEVDAAFAAYTAAIKTLADAEDALSQMED